MTARRPSRISSSAPTQVGLRDGDELQRVLNDLNDGEAAAVLQDLNNRVLPSGVVGADETATPAIHPALTDFGPKSAAKYFRQARTNAHPAIGRPTLSLRAGLRPRNPKSSRCKTAQPSNDLLLPGWQNPGPSINGDLDLYSSENQALPATSSASSDTGKSYRHTDEKLLARERIRWLPRRKNPKRVRRAGAREQTVAETNRPQPRNTFYGRFLQGDMYQGRTAQHARHEHADDISAVWEAQDARQGTPDFEIRGSNGYDMPAYAAQSNDSGQWPLLEPSEDIDPEDDDGLTSGIGPRRTMDSQAVSADGSWRPSQVPGAQRSQTFVGSRPSRLFASSHAMSHFRLPLSEDDVFDMSPEPTKRLSEGSEVTSNSHREDSVTNDELLDMKQMMLQPVASNFDREPPCDEDEGVMLPFLESASKPKTFMEQEGSSWPPSRTTLVSAASSSFEQSSSHHGATPPSTELEDSSNGRLAAQRNLAQRPEAAGVGTVARSLLMETLSLITLSRRGTHQLRGTVKFLQCRVSLAQRRRVILIKLCY